MIRINPYNEEKYDHYTVEAPTPLLEWLFAHLKDSKSKIKATLKGRGIKVNGKYVTQFDRPLVAGDKVTVSRSKKNDLFKSRYLKIVYEDQYLVIIEKAAGILSWQQATPRSTSRPSSTAISGRRDRSAMPTSSTVCTDTSGLMVYAKDMRAEQILEHEWHDLVYDRRYVAVVSGEMMDDEGTVTSWLKDNQAYFTYSSPVDNGGKYAITHYHVLDRTTTHSLVEYRLETGRKNQIRVHSADLGHPVCGDIKYGNGDDPVGRLCLHAYVLCFTHPITHQRMEFSTPVPPAFRKVFK